MKWAADHAREYGGDPRRLFLAGHSAGAHLAAMLAVQPRWLQAAGVESGAIRGLVGLSGPYALEPNTAELDAIFAAPFTPPDWQPVAQVTRSAPPALLLHGGDDDVVWPGQAEALATALRAAGVPVELEIYPGPGPRGHCGGAVVARPRPRAGAAGDCALRQRA